MDDDIEILRKAIARRHPCHVCHTALDNLEDNLNEKIGQLDEVLGMLDHNTRSLVIAEWDRR